MTLPVQTIDFLVGAVMPPIVDLVNKRLTNPKIKYLVSVIICVIVGFLVSLLSGEFTWDNVLVAAVTAIAGAQTSYKLYWRDSSLRGAT